MIVLLLIACIRGPNDTGLPPWSGTQIGEEGDGCSASAEENGEDLTELRGALAVSTTGTLRSEWQGEAALQLIVDPSGPAWTVTACGEEYPAVDAQFTLQAGPLLIVDRTLRLSGQPQTVEIAEEDLSGSLSPGALPDDSLRLLLRLSFSPETWEGQARWLLERDGHWEHAPAATWQVP